MFTIYSPEGITRSSSNLQILDPDTGTSLEFVSLIGRYAGRAFLLVQGEKMIPFNVGFDEGMTDESTGSAYFLSWIESFGASIQAEHQKDVPPIRFANPTERRLLEKTAIEALLIFGSGYNGFDMPADFFRVRYNDQLLTRRDFGYTS